MGRKADEYGEVDNEDILELARAYPQTFIPFAGLNPYDADLPDLSLIHIFRQFPIFRRLSAADPQTADALPVPIEKGNASFQCRESGIAKIGNRNPLSQQPFMEILCRAFHAQGRISLALCYRDGPFRRTIHSAVSYTHLHAYPSSELATKPLGRLLLRFAIPSIFAQIVNLLYNIVDRIFVGRIPEIGPLALAGLGVAFPIILIISSFSFLAGMGGAPLASIAMGRGDNAKAERILGSACVFLLAMSVVLTAVSYTHLGGGHDPRVRALRS